MEQSDEAIVIEPPFSLFFSVNRSTMATLNDGTFRIYNLSKKTRDLIFQDWFVQGIYRRVILEAGYGDKMNVVFSGNMFKAQSFRNGADIITEIYALDGGFDTMKTQSHITMAAGTKKSDLARIMASGMANINIGTIGNISDTFKRPVTVSGNSWQNILKYFEHDAYIDNETINILGTSEVLDVGDIPIITAETGLLETPIREEARLSFKMIFTPDILMGQAVDLQAKVMTNYNGQFKVIGVRHTGIISEAVGGECYSQFDVLLPNNISGNLTFVKAST